MNSIWVSGKVQMSKSAQTADGSNGWTELSTDSILVTTSSPQSIFFIVFLSLSRVPIWSISCQGYWLFHNETIQAMTIAPQATTNSQSSARLILSITMRSKSTSSYQLPYLLN